MSTYAWPRVKSLTMSLLLKKGSWKPTKNANWYLVDFDMKNAPEPVYFRVLYGAFHDSIGIATNIQVEFMCPANLPGGICSSNVLHVCPKKVKLKLDGQGRSRIFNAQRLYTTNEQPLQYRYHPPESKDETKVPAVDGLSREATIGSIVVWKYNESIPGGARPHLAIGRVDDITPKTLGIAMMWCSDSNVLEAQKGKKTRTTISSGTFIVLDDEIIGRLLAYRLTTA